jgi:WD40 repeat protein
MGSSRLAHGNWLTSVSFSADDRYLGTADSDGVVRLWETATGKLVWEKPKGVGGRTLAFSPDGETLAIGGYYNRMITVWNPQKDQVILEIPQNARDLKFSRGGALLAAVGQDAIVRLWDPKSGSLIKEFKGHQGDLHAVAISPDGSLLASGGGSRRGSEQNEVRLWDVRSGEEIAQLRDDNERLKDLHDTVYALEFSPDGKTLGAAGAYVVRLWDVGERKVAHRLTECSYDVAFSPIARRFVCPGDFGIYDSEKAQQLSKLSGTVGVYGCVAYSHDGKLIASGNKEGYVQLWNAQTGKEIVHRSGHEGGVRAVAFSPDGSLAASVSRDDATIRVWGMASGAELLKIPVTWRGPDVWWSEEGSDVLFAPYGREVMTWTYDSAVRYWKPDSLENRALQVGKTQATAMALSTDGMRVAVVEYKGGSRIHINIHELDGGTLETSLDPFETGSSSDPWVSSLAFSPDGKMLAVGALGRSLEARDPGGHEAPVPSVQLWDIAERSVVRRLRPAVAPPGKVCFSPDGKLLATSPVRACPLQVWRLSDGVEVRSFKVEADAHGREPAPVAFSPDGKWLAAADANREIYVWELVTGAKIRTFQGHQKAVTSIAFSPNGKTLLSGSEDATLLLWDVGGAGREVVRLTAEQLSDYWDALAEQDAEIAAGAAQALLSVPDQTLELFEGRLTAGDVYDASELPKLITDLCGDDVKASLRATSRLKSFGQAASPALFKALAEPHPLAVRRRLEEVLQSIGQFPIPPETLQRTRAIQVLEQLGSERAKTVLKRLADTSPSTTSSLDAKAALERLQQRLRAPSASLVPAR